MLQSPGLDAQSSSLPFVIDLSDDADDNEGDLYEQYGSQIPPLYAQHDAYGQPTPVATPMIHTDRATIGHLVVATIIIYITWVILQVSQYLEGTPRNL